MQQLIDFENCCIDNYYTFRITNQLVITGASDGIGKEFASQLAKKKFNLLLVSRTESKLQALAQELGMITRLYLY